MSVAVVTGSVGLVGSQAVRMLAASGYLVVDFDNDLRSAFFGPDASTRPALRRLSADLGASYVHVDVDVDVRDRAAVGAVFRRYGTDITVIVHAAGHCRRSTRSTTAGGRRRDPRLGRTGNRDRPGSW